MSKRLRVTSRVSKKGRSLRPRSFPPRSPMSSAPPVGELDFDSNAPIAESFPPPDVEEEDDSERDSAAGDDVTPAPLHAETDSPPTAEDENAAEARNEPQEPPQASSSEDSLSGSTEQPEAGSEDAQASSPEDEPAGRVEPASTDAFSGEFFRKETDSVPPSVDTSRGEADEADGSPRSLSPHVIAYQARLRKIVAGVLAGVGVLALAVAGKVLLGPRAAAPPARPTPAKVELAAPQQAAPVPQAAPSPPLAASPPPAATPETAPPPAPSGSAAPVPSEAAAAPSAAEAPPADIVALKKEAENLMNRGKFKDAIEKARVAIVADPSDALPYLYLGSSLQETGKWKEGVEAYSECVRHATKGPVHECRAMGGRK